MRGELVSGPVTTLGLVGAFARRWMLFIKQPAGVAACACVRVRVSFTFSCSGDQSAFTFKRSLHVRPAWVSEPLQVEAPQTELRVT